MDASAYIRILKGKSLVTGTRSIFPIDNTTATEIIAATPPEVFRGIEVKGCCVSANAASITIFMSDIGESPILSIQTGSGTIQIDGGVPISFSGGFTYFAPASSFVINSTNITAIYISGYIITLFECNPAQESILSMLRIRQANLSTFISSPYVNLQELDLGENNMLTSLDITSNPLLDELECNSNLLTTLDLTANPLLTRLSCGLNQLTVLDVTANPLLTLIGCDSNQLTALDLTANPLLTLIDCGFNQLTSLDLTANPALQDLECSSNLLTSLDLTANPLLTNINCSSNQLTALDLTANPLLTFVGCNSNQLTALDLTANTALQNLECSSNQLTALDITANPALLQIFLSENNLSQSAANSIVATLDTAGLTGGTLILTSQLSGPIVNPGTGSWLNLANNGWTISV